MITKKVGRVTVIIKQMQSYELEQKFIDTLVSHEFSKTKKVI